MCFGSRGSRVRITPPRPAKHLAVGWLLNPYGTHDHPRSGPTAGYARSCARCPAWHDGSSGSIDRIAGGVQRCSDNIARHGNDACRVRRHSERQRNRTASCYGRTNQHQSQNAHRPRPLPLSGGCRLSFRTPRRGQPCHAVFGRFLARTWPGTADETVSIQVGTAVGAVLHELICSSLAAHFISLLVAGIRWVASSAGRRSSKPTPCRSAARSG
jgi:hypothetical protein